MFHQSTISGFLNPLIEREPASTNNLIQESSWTSIIEGYAPATDSKYVRDCTVGYIIMCHHAHVPHHACKRQHALRKKKLVCPPRGGPSPPLHGSQFYGWIIRPSTGLMLPDDTRPFQRITEKNVVTLRTFYPQPKHII
jgi:hypothetical protein